MQRSKLTDSFSIEDEHFFRSYEAEPVNTEGLLTLEFEAVDDRPPTLEQLAHLTRFRRPVAWIMAAMGSLSLLALGQHGVRQNSRREVVAHIASATAIRTSVAAESFASVSAMPGSSIFVRAAERTSETPWSWTELAESAIALVLEPQRPDTSGSKLPSRADSARSAMQASLVNDYASELLAICRAAPS